MADDDLRQAVEEFLVPALGGDGRRGIRVALDLLDRGVPIDQVIVSLLAAAQREVGERWLRNNWTVADEHLASGVAQKALDAVANTVEPPAEQGFVVVACAEGDWHSLPAQMFAELLRSRGFAVAFLGASTPVDHVASFLSRHRPDALAVSCNLALFFSGVTRLADAAHRQGIPVIAGGRALGAGPERATRLGADAWASGIDDAVSVLHRWQHTSPQVSPEPIPVDPALTQLEVSVAEIADTAFASLCAAYPPMAAFSSDQLERTREDLAFITRFVAAARLVDDATVLTDMLDWLRTLLASRGVPPVAVDAGLTALAPPLSQTDPLSGQLALGAVQTGEAA